MLKRLVRIWGKTID